MVVRRAGRGKEILHRTGERFGVAGVPRPEGRLVWIHAASVGETMSVLPVIQALAQKCQVLLTTGTVTSAELAAARLPANAVHQFVPLDMPCWVQRFLGHWRPAVAVFVESEIWPCMLDECDSRGIPRLLINARMSAGSTANWRRAQKFARQLLGPFRHIHAQSAGDAKNLRSLGLTDIIEWGNLKFFAPELPVDSAALSAFCAAVPGPSWLAASTHPGEEALILAAHEILLGQMPGLVTVIVPRHPARGAEIAGISVSPRRSLGETPVPGKIYVADTLGELGLFFRAAPFAFVGNSLVGFGGHNIIEPALLGRAVIAGPHLENFVEAAGLLRDAGALVEVNDATSLAAAVQSWLQNPQAAAAAGEAARDIFGTAENLPDRLAALILESAL
jgi:3-deoxy-D-manno-octulosonic-acid transferase